jgi:hypothetical protein
LWCGGGHLHGECFDSSNAASTPSCCNCTLGELENPLPTSCRGCSRAKEKSSLHQSSPMQLHCVSTRNTNHKHHRHMGKACGIPYNGICPNRKFRRQAC